MKWELLARFIRLSLKKIGMERGWLSKGTVVNSIAKEKELTLACKDKNILTQSPPFPASSAFSVEG